MRIENIKISDGNFEASFEKTDNLICVLDNEKISEECYRDGFLNNLLYLFEINERPATDNEFFVECSGTVLNDIKYTAKVEKSLEKLGNLGDKSGFSSGVKRSYYGNNEAENDKSKLYNYSKLENLISLNDFEDTAVFYGDYLAETRDEDDYNYPFFSDVEDLLNTFHYGEHDKNLVEIGEKYLKEVTPIEIGNGDKFIVAPPNKKSAYWQTKLLNENDKEYNLIEESEDVGLLSLIVANNLIQQLSNYDNRFDFNYPVFISDSFINMDENYLKVILKMLKNSGRQTFIILRKPNAVIQNYCDKTVTYNYKP